MTTRQLNRLLWVTAAALLAAAGGSIVLALAFPLDVSPPTADFRLPSAAAKSTSRPADAAAADAMAGAWDIPLRRPLGDAAATQAALASAPAPPAPPTPPIVLVGTVGSSLALVRLENGTTQIVAPGETVFNVEVLTIRPAHIDVRFNGAVVTLEKIADPKAAPSPPG
jgi:hypothetical protein